MFNVLTYAPSRGGLYYLISEHGNTNSVFYIGQSKNLQKRLFRHIMAGFVKENPYVMENAENIYKQLSPWRREQLMSLRWLPGKNSCVNERVEKYKCFFRFVRINSPDKRNRIEQEEIQKLKPPCNVSKGIFKKVETSPSRPRSSLTNTITSFLHKDIACWGTLFSDSKRLTWHAKCCSPWLHSVIGEWDGQVLIIPDTDDSWFGETIDKYKNKLKAMATAQGIKLRNG